MKLTTALSSSLILLGCLLTPALAGNCSPDNDFGPCWVCGKAINSTRWQMTITTNPIDKACPNVDSSHPHCCHITNWTGTIGIDAREKRVVCRHRPLAARSSAGGNTCDKNKRFDVDAFTFADRDWVYHSKSGAGHDYDMVRGVWLKIGSNQTAECTEKNGKPYCIVYGIL